MVDSYFALTLHATRSYTFHPWFFQRRVSSDPGDQCPIVYSHGFVPYSMRIARTSCHLNHYRVSIIYVWRLRLTLGRSPRVRFSGKRFRCLQVKGQTRYHECRATLTFQGFRRVIRCPTRDAVPVDAVQLVEVGLVRRCVPVPGPQLSFLRCFPGAIYCSRGLFVTCHLV